MTNVKNAKKYNKMWDDIYERADLSKLTFVELVKLKKTNSTPNIDIVLKWKADESYENVRMSHS